MNELIYYSQNREDVILKGFFPDRNDGFYVDVGASHPNHFSVTKLFYNMGWHGLNIDANPTLVEKLELYRPRDISINIGVSDQNGQLEFREYVGHGLSTFSESIKNEYASHSNSNATKTYIDYKVEVKRLKDILNTYNISSIQFMKVDVEGYEYEVLAGNDWKQYRPEVVCIEANHIVKDWKKLLLDQDYTLVFYDGLNEYYASNESGRQHTFQYVEAVINTRPMHVDIYERMQAMQHEVAHLESEITDLELEIEDRDKYIHHLSRTKVMLMGFIRSINTIIESHLKPSASSTTLQAPLGRFEAPVTKDKKEYLSAVRAYDLKQYFTASEAKSPDGANFIRLPLYFLFRALRKSIKLIYRALKRAEE